MAAWETIASLATAAGTLVLAVATFASVRSSNQSARTAERAARTAERSLLASQRPLLVNSRAQDPEQKIEFSESKTIHVPGGQAVIDVSGRGILMALSVRNVGTGLAVMHGWHVTATWPEGRVHPLLEDFTDQVRDIYVAPGDTGFWQLALRDSAVPSYKTISAAVADKQILILSLLYGDFEGGQRVITQFVMRPATDDWQLVVARHFNIDQADPR
ncbi:MAG TPA: hypothetical protein VF979_07640 [Streptosporangiaceae bacterium]